ncbi:hypothetical protein JWG39_06155 [Desulforhopalus vacuolatus]|uniref:hypothetical protein n=1 Tax=Desulforhopalus vacuolatus TaxID=40414 RepID=UPI0019665F6B|nr:hypothetical protein [Desulforhopalus vacuolatus]MBM9519402.1 hypothetical protein [Desulforhopalus vacuolatus]
MNIDWNIKKKQGNHRPTLSYTVTLEEHEMELDMEPLTLTSTLAVVPHEERGWCLPGEDERRDDWQPTEFHLLAVPWFRVGVDSGFLRLPFRESREYPEVEISFRRLRDEYEKLVCEALRWGSLDVKASLQAAEKTKEKIAGTLVAKKMLQLAG